MKSGTKVVKTVSNDFRRLGAGGRAKARSLLRSLTGLIFSIIFLKWSADVLWSLGDFWLCLPLRSWQSSVPNSPTSSTSQGLRNRLLNLQLELLAQDLDRL